MEDLFEAIKFGAPAFTAAGQEMSTFNAIAGRMAASGIKGSNAGTALRSAITRLQKPTKDVRKGLAKFDLTMADLTKDGKLKDMVEIMGLFEKQGKKMTTVERNAALTAIVGKNAFSGWAAVMNEGVDQTKQLKEQLEGSTGAAAKMAAVMRQSLGNKIKVIFSTLTDKAFTFLEAFDGEGRAGIDSFIKSIREFDVMPIVNGLKMLFSVISFIYGIVKPFLPLMISFVAIWKAYKIALASTVVAQTLFNAVLAANPIGIVIVAIIGLIAAIKDLNDNWDLYSLNFKIKLNEIVLGWKAVKAQVLDVMATLGLADRKMATAAFKDFGASLIKQDIAKLEQANLRSQRGMKTGPVELRSVGQTISEPLLQRESIRTSAKDMLTSFDVNIRNQSSNDVDSKGQNIPPGQNRVLASSG